MVIKIILLMEKFDFDDTQTSGIVWSTHLAIRDACIELKSEMNCSDRFIIELLTSIIHQIEKDGL